MTSASNKRIATSRDDLRVGQVVIVRRRSDGAGWEGRNPWVVEEGTLAQGVDQWLREYEVVILSDPPPEPVTVSRAAFDRLAHSVDNRAWGQPFAGTVEVNARKLVEEVRAQKENE